MPDSRSFTHAAVTACIDATSPMTPVPRPISTGRYCDTLNAVHISLELSRLVLEGEVPANGESRFSAQAFRLAGLRGIRDVVSFSDPLSRAAADGTTITPGHAGIIYQAPNAACTRRPTERSLGSRRICATRSEWT